MSILSIFKNPSPEEIKEKLTQAIVIASIAYRKELKNAPSHLSTHAGAELSYLLLHLLDRTAFSELGSAMRDDIFDDVSKMVIEGYSSVSLSQNAPMELQESLRDKMFSELSTRQNVYSQCDSLA